MTKEISKEVLERLVKYGKFLDTMVKVNQDMINNLPKSTRIGGLGSSMREGPTNSYSAYALARTHLYNSFPELKRYIENQKGENKKC